MPTIIMSLYINNNHFPISYTAFFSFGHRDRLEQIERQRERDRKLRDQQKEQRDFKDRERRAEERRKEREARRDGQ